MIILVCIICSLLICATWGSYFYTVRNTRNSLCAMFNGRQRTIISYSGDIMEGFVKNVRDVRVMGMSVEPIATQLLEEFIVSGRIESMVQNRKSLSYQPAEIESIAYGNFILYLDNNPVSAMGYLDNDFKRDEQGRLQINNTALQSIVHSQIRKVQASKHSRLIVSQTVDIKGRPTLVATGPLKIGENTAFLTLYEDRDRILHRYGFYKQRKRQIFFASLISCLILLYSGVLILSLKRAGRDFHRLERTAAALETEMSERLLAEKQVARYQEQLNQTQKMEAVGTLAGGIAHDFNNLLTVIMGNAEIALMNLLPGEPPHRELNQIFKASQRARDLTMKMLTFARKEKLSEKSVSVNAVIENDLMPMIERSMPGAFQISLALKHNLQPVHADVNQLLQAFFNICTNARDAMGESGILTIESGHIIIEKNEPHQSGPREGRWCFVRFTDNGAGMAPKVLQKVCEPFFTTKPMGHGAGLGMSVTHGIIASHNGNMTIASEPGQGTVVTVFLPFAQGNISAKERPMHNRCVLIVDDEKDVLDFIRDIFVQEGYEILTADNGRDAVALCDANGPRLSLAVIDRHLPDTQGMDLANRIKGKCPSCGVILISGDHSQPSEDVPGDQAHIAKFLRKPFEINELLSMVHEVLDKK